MDKRYFVDQVDLFEKDSANQAIEIATSNQSELLCGHGLLLGFWLRFLVARNTELRVNFRKGRAWNLETIGPVFAIGAKHARGRDAALAA
jgi:hypothetical protein